MFSTWALRFAPRFEHHVPRHTSEAWLKRFVDTPKFGWDLGGLDTGWSAPLYRFIDAQALADEGEPLGLQHRFMRSALACTLMGALPGGAELDPLAFDLELSALELHASASTMLDHLDNGRELATSQGAEQALALPVLITTAYCARQLAASMLWRTGRDHLAQRFARLLMLQGIGHTLDLHAGELMLPHTDVQSLEDHLRWYVAPLDFELVCELAAAATGLSPEAGKQLVSAGSDLGVAWHCAIALARLERSVPASAPPLRWRCMESDLLVDALNTLSTRCLTHALETAHALSPAVGEVLERFYNETLAGIAPALEVS